MKKQIKDALTLKKENNYKVKPSATVVIPHVEGDLFKEFKNMVAGMTVEAVQENEPNSDKRIASVTNAMNFIVANDVASLSGKVKDAQSCSLELDHQARVI